MVQATDFIVCCEVNFCVEGIQNPRHLYGIEFGILWYSVVVREFEGVSLRLQVSLSEAKYWTAMDKR